MTCNKTQEMVHCLPCQGQGQARKGPSLNTDLMAFLIGALGHCGLSDRSWRIKKVVRGHCVELKPKTMKIIPEVELTHNLMKMNSQIFRGSDGEDLILGGKTPA